MSQALPEDLDGWMSQLGLHQAVSALSKNVLLAFIDGVVVAEIVNARFPRLVQLHSYTKTSSASGRKTNWELLNKKVLAVISCELGKDDIAKISNRNIEKEAVLTFLRILKAKMDSYEQTYKAGMQNMATDQKVKVRNMSMRGTGNIPTSAAASENVSDDSSVSTYTSSSSRRRASTVNSMSVAPGAESAMRRPSMAKTNQILNLKKDKSKDHLKERAKSMTERDIDAAYEQVSGAILQKIDDDAEGVDEMLQRSHEINSTMSALREQNKDDMVKIERRLSTLHMQLNRIENEPNAPSGDDDKKADLDETVGFDESSSSSNKSAFIGVSRRGSILSQQLLKLIPAGSVATENPEMEKQISRRSSAILQNRVGIKIPSMDMGIDSDYSPSHSPSKRLSQSQKSMAHGKSTNSPGASSTKASTIFAFQGQRQGQETSEGEHVHSYKDSEASHRRVFDPASERFFYVEIATDASSWSSPSKGIVECVDDKSGRVFFINVETKASGWSVSEVI